MKLVLYSATLLLYAYGLGAQAQFHYEVTGYVYDQWHLPDPQLKVEFSWTSPNPELCPDTSWFSITDTQGWFRVVIDQPRNCGGAIGTMPLSLPAEFELSPNYPNPFDDGTWIEVAATNPPRNGIEIYNLLGQHVKTLVGPAKRGVNLFYWNGSDDAGRLVAAGIYFARVTGPTPSNVIRMFKGPGRLPLRSDAAVAPLTATDLNSSTRRRATNLDEETFELTIRDTVGGPTYVDSSFSMDISASTLLDTIFVVDRLVDHDITTSYAFTDYRNPWYLVDVDVDDGANITIASRCQFLCRGQFRVGQGALTADGGSYANRIRFLPAIGYDWNGIELTDGTASGSVLRYCGLRGPGGGGASGLSLDGCPGSVTVANLVITGWQRHGIEVNDWDGEIIHCDIVANHNTANDAGTGIMIYANSNPLIDYCEFVSESDPSQNWDHIHTTDRATIHWCNFAYSGNNGGHATRDDVHNTSFQTVNCTNNWWGPNPCNPIVDGYLYDAEGTAVWSPCSNYNSTAGVVR
jgi:hypothetical protein